MDFVLSLFATRQWIAAVTVRYALLHVWNQLKYLAVSAHDKALTRCPCTLPQAALCSANAFVYQALHLEYLFLLHAFSPSSGLLYLS